MYIGIRTLFDRVTRGYGDHSPPTSLGTPWMLSYVGARAFFFDCGRVLFGSRVAEMRRRVTVRYRHQLKQASKHHKLKRASLVATGAMFVDCGRGLFGSRVAETRSRGHSAY